MILPEPDYPLVIIVETGVVKLWDRKNNRPVEMEGAPIDIKGKGKAQAAMDGTEK